MNKDLHGSELTSHQEPGVRPSCALPYELYADGGLSADRSKFTLTMKAGNAVHGKRSIGAPFNVYVRNGKTMRAATFTVSAGDALHENSRYLSSRTGNTASTCTDPMGFIDRSRETPRLRSERYLLHTNSRARH